MSKLNSLVKDPIRWGATVSGILILGVIWIAVSQVPASATTGGAIPSPREGFLAPDFTLETLQGDMVTLSDLRGKAVVVGPPGVRLAEQKCRPSRRPMRQIETEDSRSWQWI